MVKGMDPTGLAKEVDGQIRVELVAGQLVGPREEVKVARGNNQMEKAFAATDGAVAINGFPFANLDFKPDLATVAATCIGRRWSHGASKC